MSNLTIGDLLKSEADPNSRVAVPAPAGTKAGTFVDYPVRGKKIVALTDEKNGEVLIQPHNCTIDLQNLTGEALTVAGFTDVDTLKTEGDAHGVVYVGEPATPITTPPVGNDD